MQSWDKKYKATKGIEINEDVDCSFNGCQTDVTEGYFCDKHKKDIKILGDDRKQIVYKTSSIEMEKISSGEFPNQPYLLIGTCL